MATFINNIKYRFSTASMPMKIIYINIAVFLALRIAGIICFFAGIDSHLFLRWIEAPSSAYDALYAPWTIITYMFAHYDIMHILFNMLMLYWFGTLFLNYFTPKQFVALYLIGGIGGWILYTLAFAFLPVLQGVSSLLIGASASVMAIVIALAIKAPHYRIGLLFLGDIPLKWIAIGYIVIDLLSITGNNMGGHLAHLGGAFAGAIFATLLSRGTDITKPLNNLIDYLTNFKDSFKLFSFKKKNSFSHNSSKKSNNNYKETQSHQPSGKMSKEDEATLDIILDKIKQSGYSSLTQDEKKRLFQVSNKK